MRSFAKIFTAAVAATASLSVFSAPTAHAFAQAPIIPIPSPTASVTPKPSVTPSATPQPSASPSAAPSPVSTPSGYYQAKIISIASQSACSNYSWKDRGTAPAGYMKGMALSFARSLCRFDGYGTLRGPASDMAQADTGKSLDAISWFAGYFPYADIHSNSADTLRSTYTLAMGLGMRESSGEYCTGRDLSAGTETASSAETGPFQVSYDSFGASSDLAAIYGEYQAHPEYCALSTWKEGVNTSDSGCKPASLGTGAGRTFQDFTKSCPAFAAEYAVSLMRVLRTHWGPLNRYEAEVNNDCDSMFKDVQTLVEQDGAAVCGDFF